MLKVRVPRAYAQGLAAVLTTHAQGPTNNLLLTSAI